MARIHHLLATRPDNDDQWSLEFNDADRDTVEVERQAYLAMGWKVRELRILPFHISGDEPTVAEIERAIERLNNFTAIGIDAVS